MKYIALGHIVKGRHTTIVTHLHLFPSYLSKYTKLEELECSDRENYFNHRHKTINCNFKQVRFQNEHGTINGLRKWLHKNGETHIESLHFEKLPCLDKGVDTIRSAALHSNPS